MEKVKQVEREIDERCPKCGLFVCGHYDHVPLNAKSPWTVTDDWMMLFDSLRYSDEKLDNYQEGWNNALTVALQKCRLRAASTPEAAVLSGGGKLRVHPDIYASPVYLQGLLRRIMTAYFEKEWKSVERLLEANVSTNCITDYHHDCVMRDCGCWCHQPKAPLGPQEPR